MTKSFKTKLFFSISALLLQFAPVQAEDLALIVNNRTYRYQTNTGAPNSIGPVATQFKQAGYKVVSARNAKADKALAALDEVLDNATEGDRLVIVLAGHFVHSDSDTWLVPVDMRVPDLANIYYDSISLNVLLSVLERHPGKAALFLGDPAIDVRLGNGLEAGLGEFTAPQGVFVVRATPAALYPALTEHYLDPDTGLATATELAGDTVMASGFISDVTLLGPIAADGDMTDDDMTGELDAEAVEDIVWALTIAIRTPAAFDAYLALFPQGRFTAEAAARQVSIVEEVITPEMRAQEIENALNLNRDARRQIQQDLTDLGHSTRGVDGIFGQGTRRAISQWQQANGFQPTGYLNARQIRRLAVLADQRRAEIAEEQRQQQAAQRAQDQAYWQQTGASGQPADLQRYLNRYPNGLYAANARQQLQQINDARNAENQARLQDRAFWQQTGARGTLAGLQRYLNRYPSGMFSVIAQTQLLLLQQQQQSQEQARAEDRAFWRQTGANGTKQGLLRYLNQYPNGLFSNEARAALQQIENEEQNQNQNAQDRNDWNAAKQADTVQSYRRYLRNWPNGRFADRAQARIAEIENAQQQNQNAQDRDAWNAAKQADTIPAYRRYLRDWPNGRFTDRAQARIAEIENAQQQNQNAQDRDAWNAAKQTDTIPAYRDYLRNWPNGNFADRARNRIDQLQANQNPDPAPNQLQDEENRFVKHAVAREIVEARLSKLGFDPGPVDGVFDGQTRQAVRQYQQSINQPVTGFVTQMTFVLLMQTSD